VLRFFRQIRQRLLIDNKFSKYLLYAIGEILLVVIGILIALQVNNWNEHRKEKDIERKVLLELKRTIESNQGLMEWDSVYRTMLDNSSDIVLRVIKNKQEYADTLNTHFQLSRIPGTILQLSTAGYESLKNVGFNIISSDSLRNQIVDLFELYHKNLYDSMEYFESFQPGRQLLIDELFMYEVEAFDALNPVAVPIIPHNYNTLLEDKKYLSMIKSVKIHRNMIGLNTYGYLAFSRQVLQLLNEELEHFKNTETRE
jgi:hypothetical protein